VCSIHSLLNMESNDFFFLLASSIFSVTDQDPIRTKIKQGVEARKKYYIQKKKSLRKHDQHCCCTKPQLSSSLLCAVWPTYCLTELVHRYRFPKSGKRRDSHVMTMGSFLLRKGQSFAGQQKAIDIHRR